MSAITLPELAVGPPSLGIGNDDLYEVIDGKRVGLPPMGIYSVLLASYLVRHLGNFADAKALGRAVAEGLFHMPAPVNRDRRPDVAFVSYDRWPKTRSVPRTDNAWDVVPNLATEVVSPTDSVYELEQKIVEYFQVGVELVWVVYPSQSKIHVLVGPTQIQVLTATDVLDGGAVLPGFRLPLADLFAEPAENVVSP
jgi:Uma2 family endonuclease